MDWSEEGSSHSEMAVNVFLSAGSSYNRYELLAWLNETLQTGFTKVQQIYTGAAYCQLMDCLFHGSLELSRVRFQSSNTVDLIHNYSLLQAAFRKVGVVRFIPIEALMKKNPTVSLTFLRWFKLFFDKNYKCREYHALEARGGQSMRMVPDDSDDLSSETPHQKLEIIVKMDGKTAEEQRKEKSREMLNGISEVIVLISDDEDDVMAVAIEPKQDKMDVTNNKDCEQAKETVEQPEAAVDRGRTANCFYSSDTLLRFINRYCSDNVDSNLSTDGNISGPSLSAFMSTFHLKDIVQACSKTPYCLYLYMGVDLGEGQSTSIVLIGYFDQKFGNSAVRLLHTLQMSVDTADSQSSADSDTENVTADSDAHLLLDMLKTWDLALSNLAVFYCDASHRGLSQRFMSLLRPYSPSLLSLCGLPGIAGRACQAALSASFKCVVDLVKDIHHHYTTYASVNDSLKEIFAGAENYDPSHPVSSQCLFIIRTVQKIAVSWRDLVEYFKSLGGTKDAHHIRTQLMDYKVKLRFLFLSQSLEPLRAIQELQQFGRASVAVELQLASILIKSFAASILKPSVVESFLSRRQLHFLHSDKELLPKIMINVGSRAWDVLCATAVVDLGEQERCDFREDVFAFYKAALQSIVESVPEQLGDVELKNIVTVLKHPENIQDDRLSRQMLSEMGYQLGVCNASSRETHQLGHDFFTSMKTLRRGQRITTGEGHVWTKTLKSMKAHSTLHRFILTLLALPDSLNRKQVFSMVVKAQPQMLAGKSHYRRTKIPARGGCGGKIKAGDEGSSSEESSGFVNKPSRIIPSTHSMSMEDSDYTDNSSDVVDVTESSKLENQQSQQNPPSEIVYIVGSDDDGDNDAMVSTNEQCNSKNAKGDLVWGKVEGFSLWPAITMISEGQTQPPQKTMVEWYGQKMFSQVDLQTLKPYASFAKFFCANSFATIHTYKEAIFLSLEEAALRCKKHFSTSPGDRDELLRQMLHWAFGGFLPTGSDGFKTTALINGDDKRSHTPKVKKKLFLKASSSPHSTSAGCKSDTSAEIKDVTVSLKRESWASTKKSSFKISNGNTALERLDLVGKGTRGGMKEKVSRGGCASAKHDKERWEEEKDSWGGGGWEKLKRGWGRGRGRGGWRGGKGQGKKSSLLDGFDDDTSPDFVPFKKKNFVKTLNKVNQSTNVYTQPDQKVREETIIRINDMKLNIEDFCLCCGTEDIEISHPLFKGSLCLKCKDNFTETLYRYDEDGYQSYCTICCYGMEVILCGNDSCCRSYCNDCVNILIGPGTFDTLTQVDPWICFLCQPHKTHGALIPREDWSIRVQGLFPNNSAMAFEPHRVYPSIPANQRRPLRVLSLFDGIATGYVVLKDLGFRVEQYFASEVCDDSIAVATINHDAKIIQVGDVRVITKEQIEEWGPFDLLIGGSPCNDLSIVNPIRKGIYEGTGRLFFEYYRILQLLKPKEEDPRPFFWLFENVVFMNTHDKVNICRFLECNPVLVDAVKVSPAHRARYFWGNIPGMSRPIIASQSDRLTLQDCLEIGRQAQVTKVRTITTNPNSLKQGKYVNQLPVLQDGREDNLWITELEKIFGFPKHYTDVRNMNRQQRQKVLGKAWSVPVVRHLFAPLKDYFACEQVLTMSTTSNMSTLPNSSTSSTPHSSLSCPASPELQQLR
ncbi:uncharacterized protein LOC131469012 isoform X2 [Solea solea]|uniref:uncharacterized protein LOC131469012 isoform X2 n=1 Tax=Solea solea TaxID=90069 RepID=UPI00272CE1B7|nr:uncharacterized protein LOC131469012 isoform X2 [Solea solea]